MGPRESLFLKAANFTLMFTLLLLPLAIIPILSTWVGEGAKELLKGNSLSGFDSKLFGYGLLSLLALSAFLIWKGRALLPVRIVEQTPSFEKRRVLVALLSPCENLVDRGKNCWDMVDKKSGTVVWSIDNESLEELVKQDKSLPGLTWQQTLRAAHYHGNRLDKLVLVGSRDGSGTNQQLTLAKSFFSAYFPGKVVIYGIPRPGEKNFDTRWQADFEDLTAVNNLLRNILCELKKDAVCYADRDISIDVTGGQKTASIAAALMTLHRPDLIFQYVGTGKHAGQVTGFNVSTGTVAG